MRSVTSNDSMLSIRLLRTSILENFLHEAGIEKKRGTLSRLKNIMSAVVRIVYEELMHC